MDKNSFLSAFKKNSVGYTLPSGEIVVLYELTAGQRSKLNEVIREKPDNIQIAVVAMSLDFCADDDFETVGAIPSKYIEEMAEKVLSLSGYMDVEEAQGN